MRAPGLHDVSGLDCTALELALQFEHRRQQRLLDQQIGSDMDRRGDHVVAALAHIDVVVWMDRTASARKLGGAARDHLVRVHVGRGARPRLKNIDRKFRVPTTIRDFSCRRHDQFDLLARDKPEPSVYLRRGQFD